jgi:hypothetical protein
VVEDAEVSNVTAGDTYSYVGLFTSKPIVILCYQINSTGTESRTYLEKHIIQLGLFVLALCLSVKDSQIIQDTDEQT